MIWSEHEYWKKGRLYIGRAQSARADEGLYPFWMALAMEFIARAALSKVSPVLNADPKKVDNIYFALGVKDVGKPQSLPLHAVFTRCVSLVDGFEDKHRAFCDLLALQRNEELHTGALTFENLNLNSWLQRYYEVLDIFCRHLDHDLDDLLGTDEANVAREMVKGSAEGLESSVKQRIAAHKRVFEDKDKDERQQLSNSARIQSQSGEITADLATTVECPACSSSGLVTGREIRKSEPYLKDDYLVEEIRGMTEAFVCYACGLRLSNLSEIRWSGIEPNFTAEASTSLHELQEMEYYMEYMNE